MTVHHFDCGTLRPFGERLLRGEGRWTGRHRMASHCLLVETQRSLVLVDSGFGLEDVAQPARRLGRAFRRLMGPALDPRQTAVRQVAALGFDPTDVRHVVLTHLDFDHAGGLADFPHATVHLLRDELVGAMRVGLQEAVRYRPQQWGHGVTWLPHETDGDSLLGFAGVTAVVEPDVLLVPLPGHSAGHAGVAVRQGERWLLHCGDGYFARVELDPITPRCPPALELLQRGVAADRAARRQTRSRLRELARQSAQWELVCSHDPDELPAAARQEREQTK